MPKNDDNEHTERLQLRVSKRFLRLLDEWRDAQEIVPSRAEAIRRAVEIAAAASQKKPRRLVERGFAEPMPSFASRIELERPKKPRPKRKS